MSESLQIITADCSDPKEIDDGLLVERIDASREVFRVDVCIADTEKAYKNPEIVDLAYKRTAAKYWDLPGGERGYDPMIDPELISDLELTEGNIRDVLKISFVVGEKHPPSDVDISFEQVEVVANKSYKAFAESALFGRRREYLQASGYIQDHLKYIAYGDHVGTHPQWREGQTQKNASEDIEPAVVDLSSRMWKKGSKINEAFMVAANHLVGKTLADEGWPAIYRVHDPEDEQFMELLSASAARYSWSPGLHSGLRLDPYCRVTSPLRRLDDFVMNNQLKQRFLGIEPTARNTKDVRFAVRRLNQEIIAAAPRDLSRLNKRDLLGRAALTSRATLEADYDDELLVVNS